VVRGAVLVVVLLVDLVAAALGIHQDLTPAEQETLHQYLHYLVVRKVILAGPVLLRLVQQLVEVGEVEVPVLLDRHRYLHPLVPVVLVVLAKLLLLEILDYLVYMECLDLLLDAGLPVAGVVVEMLVILLHHLVDLVVGEMEEEVAILDLLEKLILDLEVVVEKVVDRVDRVVLEL
jgi:hypothetical protein